MIDAQTQAELLALRARLAELEDPEWHAVLEQSVELEGEEIRPELKLSADEIAQLEAEKRALTDGYVKPKSDASRIRGEGTAIETGPVRATQSMRQRAEAARALEPLHEPRRIHPRLIEFNPPPQFGRQQPTRKLGDVDPEVLARLLAAAKNASTQAEQYRQYADDAEAEARETREALDSYMVEFGLR